MQTPSSGEAHVTVILRRVSAGERSASEELLPLVYQQLRRTAEKYLGQERKDHTLQATALVHEAYLRLVGNERVSWDDRAHFYFATAEAMRRILIEHARARARLKRGGDGERPARRELLGELDLTSLPESDEVVMLDDALRRLETEDAQAARVVQLRFFAGLSVDETAAALGISPSTVDREWAFARAWLHREMRRQ